MSRHELLLNHMDWILVYMVELLSSKLLKLFSSNKVLDIRLALCQIAWSWKSKDQRSQKLFILYVLLGQDYLQLRNQNLKSQYLSYLTDLKPTSHSAKMVVWWNEPKFWKRDDLQFIFNLSIHSKHLVRSFIYSSIAA